MSNHKTWEEVAPYYLNSDIRATGGDEEVFMVECRRGLVLWQYSDESMQDFPLEDIDGLPALRHIEDITPAEFIILAERKYGKGNERAKKVLEQLKAATKVKFLYHFKDRKYISFRYYPAPGLDGEAIIYYHDFLTALQLIEWGFDLFGLIESGQAIRKEAKSEN